MSSRHEAKYCNTALRVCGVYKLLTALLAFELALPEVEIPKRVCSMQYQFKVFKNVNCLMSLRRCHLDRVAMLLFHNNIIQF